MPNKTDNIISKMESKKIFIKERILQIAKIKRISYESFFEGIGMSYGNFKGKAKSSPINSDTIATILTKYSDINPEWLLLGIGDMIKNGYTICDENLKDEIRQLKDTIIEKNAQLLLKDEIIKSKDEIIQLLRERSK